MALTGSERASVSQEVGFFSSHIIAILASILFPVFARAREKARQTSCLSNQKQLAMACSMYAQDYDEEIVNEDYDYSANGTTNEAGVDGTWRSALLPYVKNTQIFICASHKPAATVFNGSTYDCGQNASYAINDVHQSMPGVPCQRAAHAERAEHPLTGRSRPGPVRPDGNQARPQEGIRAAEGLRVT